MSTTKAREFNGSKLTHALPKIAALTGKSRRAIRLSYITNGTNSSHDIPIAVLKTAVTPSQDMPTAIGGTAARGNSDNARRTGGDEDASSDERIA